MQEQQVVTAPAAPASGSASMPAQPMPSATLTINGGPPAPSLTVDQKLSRIAEINSETVAMMIEYKVIADDLLVRMRKLEAAIDGLSSKVKTVAAAKKPVQVESKDQPKEAHFAATNPTVPEQAQASKKKGDDAVALTIVEINTTNVVIKDAQQKQYIVAPGGKLPGGATYVGYEPKTRTMRTDVGDFRIP